MKYGKPSDMITVNDDPSSAPYEVWLYYDILSLLNPMSSFISTTLLDGMDYRLHNPMRVAKSEIPIGKRII